MNDNDVSMQEPVDQQQTLITNIINTENVTTNVADDTVVVSLVNNPNETQICIETKSLKESNDHEEVNTIVGESFVLQNGNDSLLDKHRMDVVDENGLYDIIIKEEIVKVKQEKLPITEITIHHVERQNDAADEQIVQELGEKNDVEIVEQENSNDNREDNVNLQSQDYQMLYYEWNAPKLICKATKDFKPTESCENFTKGCLWSPDGTCILVPSEDFRVRLFELPRELYSGVLPKDFRQFDLEASLKIKEGGTIYDTCWFPYMSSWDPSTCCFLSTSQGSPVHLWDAFTGQLRATYRAYNLVDEVEAAISVQFTDLGGQIWTGFKNALRIFDTNRPGRQIHNIFLKKDFPNVTGLVSCIRDNPEMPGLIAFGTYTKCIGLYKDGPICTFKTGNGVTQIEFSPCGTRLYSTVRRSDELLCWDLRNPGTVLYSLENRQSNTNQKIWFDLSYNEKDIISGGTDGLVKVWKISSDINVDEDINPTYNIKLSKDCVNGVSLHKNLPILAVSTGERKFSDEEIIIRDNSLRFYWLSG